MGDEIQRKTDNDKTIPSRWPLLPAPLEHGKRIQHDKPLLLLPKVGTTFFWKSITCPRLSKTRPKPGLRKTDQFDFLLTSFATSSESCLRV